MTPKSRRNEDGQEEEEKTDGASGFDGGNPFSFYGGDEMSVHTRS